jgi:para-aminobenzoate synthetase component 1
MLPLDMSATQVVSALLALSETETVCILDSCGVFQLGSRFLIAGIRPVEVIEVEDDVNGTLKVLDECIRSNSLASIFSLSYGLGLKLHGLKSRHTNAGEPDIFLSAFDCLVVHDYQSAKTWIAGEEKKQPMVRDLLSAALDRVRTPISATVEVRSNFTRGEYLGAVEEIKELIRAGDTYQTNLTQQLRVTLPEGRSPQDVFQHLRETHPAPFAAFLKRSRSVAVSASPERFFRVADGTITVSPIKGTRRRGTTEAEDARLRAELLSSEKDRAENTMIVDLMRNDIGRICEYGSVMVDELCKLEEHPSLFHLVSSVSGRLKPGIEPSVVVRSLFPCGSVTGAPKHRTLEIIDAIETAPRGLSMGAIGYSVPPSIFGLDAVVDLNVAIRTMVISEGEAVFNVGGGIVIESEPEAEFDESMLKAAALIRAIAGTAL